MANISDRQLKLWYTQYNRCFFNSELPESVILVWEPVPACHGETTTVFEIEQGVFSVKIDPALKGVVKFAKITLLHEMVHIALWARHPQHQHGKLFNDRMLKLAQDGALKKLW